MSVEFKNSETKINLMRAFAGESQARNRYTFAAEQAHKQELHVIEAAFLFTAGQEKEHAGIFYQHLQELAGETVTIDGGFPVDISSSMVQLLRQAHHNEYEEYEDAYKHFGDTTEQEGFPQIAASFRMIGAIEKIHGDRFGMLADLLEQNKLFVSDVECQWMCLNCGHTYSGKEAPQKCPVCDHDRGYFIRLTLAPYTDAQTIR